MLTEDSVPEICKATGVDVLAEQEKNYYCQRCLNHGEYKPRKGHKPDCRYLQCPCAECTMVERRRQLNNMLSKKKVHCAPNTQTRDGKRVRDPHCARCSAHGVLVPLRGHKRTMCQFVTCTCTLCALVENRRMLMAAQIKLRRSQQKTRDGKEPKIRRCRKIKDINIENLNTLMMVVTTTTEDQKRTGTSTSPSPSSTTDTMSPSQSVSPPSSPSPSVHSIHQNTPILAAPIPVYPPISMPNLQQLLQQQILLTYLQNIAPSPPPPQPMPFSTLAPSNFVMSEQSLALCNMYLQGCLKI
ncbi:hypothetical protein GCK72_003637 [Caenorhabditis remanei]|uniref:DM domain-containing protein n=2 Tax=Caenorhabditis remanei TaxID=31234 RepID=A0A6A5HBC6_CAERE|nr:hypothetical protein GCK72_003637 [Caenorhabditis remanei]KAF1763692.1 hypothetical protein GCK72_003637 [Caenorhabditis remanei]